MNASTDAMVHVVDHPLILHKLTLMRQKETSTAQFRQLLREMSLLLGYEVTRDLPLASVPIETPLVAIEAPVIEGKKLCLIAILRAGDGIVSGLLDLVPSARVGHIGLYRDPATLVAVEYYYKVPDNLAERLVIVADPLLATGNTAIAAVDRLKESGAQRIKFVCVVAAPEGLAAFREAHPDVPVYTAAVDERLDDRAFIVPGIGDVGDRLYGTK
jgi:uracil phosphoribosyltransferase